MKHKAEENPFGDSGEEVGSCRKERVSLIFFKLQIHSTEIDWRPVYTPPLNQWQLANWKKKDGWMDTTKRPAFYNISDSQFKFVSVGKSEKWPYTSSALCLTEQPSSLQKNTNKNTFPYN